MRTLIVAFLVLAGAAGGALAQQPPPGTVVRDVWAVHWRGQHRVGWSHDLIEERPDAPAGGARFVVAAEQVLTWAGGEVRLTSRQEVDAHGRLLSAERVIASPYGEQRVRVGPRSDGPGLTYRCVVRALPPAEGVIEQAVWSVEVLGLLAMRGAQPPGERTVDILDLPGPGTESRTFTVAREGRGWKVSDEDWTGWYDAQGRPTRFEAAEELGLSVALASEDEVRRSTSLPPKSATVVDEAPAGGLRVRRPGPGWRLLRREMPPMVGVEHPGEVAAVVMTLPLRLPQDERERLRLAEQMRQRLRERPQEPGNVMELGPPRIATWRDLPAVRFTLGGVMDTIPVAGEAFLVGGEGVRSHLVMVACPADLREQVGDLVREASAHVEVAPAAPEAAWQREGLGRLSLERPAGWRRAEDGSFRSPLDASRIQVTSDRIPGVDLLAAQQRWVEQQRANPNFTMVEVERQGYVKADRQVGHLVVLRCRVREREGLTVVMRAASFLFQHPDGSFTEVLVLACDHDWEHAHLERVIDSIRWSEDR